MVGLTVCQLAKSWKATYGVSPTGVQWDCMACTKRYCYWKRRINSSKRRKLKDKLVKEAAQTSKFLKKERFELKRGRRMQMRCGRGWRG